MAPSLAQGRSMGNSAKVPAVGAGGASRGDMAWAVTILLDLDVVRSTLSLVDLVMICDTCGHVYVLFVQDCGIHS